MAQSVGEQLKQTRLARGLTLDQAAQTTRIRRHYLEAIERDDHDSLPSPVQGRGFLRLYAGYLDLPVEILVAQWEGRPLPETSLAPISVESHEPPPPTSLTEESSPLPIQSIPLEEPQPEVEASQETGERPLENENSFLHRQPTARTKWIEGNIQGSRRDFTKTA